jgi:hypothetical protein
MGVPIEKRLGNVQKALLTRILDGGKSFDLNNPEDVKKQKEIAKQVEAMQSISSLVTDPTGGGLVGMTRGISKAALAKMSKSKFTQNKVKQLADLVTKPMTRGKKAVPKTVKKATSDISANVVTPRSAKSERINSLSNQLPSSRFNPNIVTSTARKKSKEIGGFKIGESAIETSKASKVVPKTTPTITPNIPTTVPTSGTTVPIKEMWKTPLPTPSYTIDGFRIGGTEAKSILNKLKDSEAARTATKKAFEKSNAEIIKKGIESSNKKITDKVIGAGLLTGVLGAGAGTTYYGMQLSNKDNKQTTGPVDLKRIDKSKLKPSKVEGVSIVKGSDGKDYGIKWNNTTKSWDYYRGNNKPVVEPITPKPKIVKEEDIKDGNVTPIDNNNQNKKTGTGDSTTPRSATGQAFDKAFAEARKQAGGASGIFEWNGKKYGTALKGETVPKDRVEVGKTTAPVTIKNEYPTAKSDPSLEQAIQEDSIRQQREMYLEKIATKPLSSIVFKPTSPTVLRRDKLDESDALYRIKGANLIRNKLPLEKKRYGGNLAMLKYMK